MKALALVTALSLTFALAANAQDSKPSLKSNGVTRQGAEAAATIDVSAIQKKIDEYTEAIKNDPKNDANYGARGQSFKRLGKFDNAVDDLSKAISLNPRRQAYFEVRANTFGKLNRYREAFNDYNKAIEIGPPSFSLFLKKGQVAFLQKDFRAGLQSAKAALSLKPDALEALIVLGTCEQKLGLLQDSLKHLNRAVELSPSDAAIINARAETYSALGKEDLARLDIAKARKLGASP